MIFIALLKKEISGAPTDIQATDSIWQYYTILLDMITFFFSIYGCFSLYGCG